MIKLATLFWLVLVSATGFVMFAVKYEVQALDDELSRTGKAVAAEDHEIRVLDAEWAYLTRPETLEDMNRRFLSLGPMATRQLHATVTDIPLRATPPAPVEVAAIAAPPVPDSAPPPALAAIPAVPDQQAAAPERPATAAAVARPVPVKAVVRPSTPRRPKSLDDLFAQIAASR